MSQSQNATQLVISFQALDKPGIVNQLSLVVHRHHGNWLDSRLSELGGIFSGLIAVSISLNDVEALKTDLFALSDIDVSVYEDSDAVNKSKTTLRLELVGPDRKGIIEEISRALAAHGLNIHTMESSIASAPMSGEPLFSANISFSSDDQNIAQIEEAIDEIADELTLDICFSEEVESE